MRILRGLSSKLLAWACIAGVYETYDALVIAVIDVAGPTCTNEDHVRGKAVPADDMVPVIKNTSSDRR